MEESTSGGPKFRLLDSVGAVFEQNERERQRRISAQQDKRRRERQYSQHLRSVLPRSELDKAKSVALQWAKKNDNVGRVTRRLLQKSPHRRNPTGSVLRDDQNINNRCILSSVDRQRSSEVPEVTILGSRSSTEGEISRPFTPTRDLDDNFIVISDSEQDNQTDIDLAIQISLQDNRSSSHLTDLNSNPVEEIQTDSTHTCPILNCEAIFDTDEKLKDHCRQFKHSPCNPCKLSINCKLPFKIQGYLCPKCGEEFKLEEKCIQHMATKNHHPFLPVIPVSGYMCPQCLMISGNKETCQRHMTENKHIDFSFPFSDDMLCLCPTPVAISPGFAQDFAMQCNSVGYTLFCADCLMDLESNNEASYRDNHSDHIVLANSSSTPAEVFMSYLSSYQCDNCGVILPATNTKLHDLHECNTQKDGIMKETCVKSFREFVRMISLQFVLLLSGELRAVSSTNNNSSVTSTPKSQGSSDCSMRSVDSNAQPTGVKDERKSQATQEIFDVNDDDDDCIIILDSPVVINYEKTKKDVKNDEACSSTAGKSDLDSGASLFTPQSKGTKRSRRATITPSSSSKKYNKLIMRDGVCVSEETSNQQSTPKVKHVRKSRFTDKTPPVRAKPPMPQSLCTGSGSLTDTNILEHSNKRQCGAMESGKSPLKGNTNKRPKLADKGPPQKPYRPNNYYNHHTRNNRYFSNTNFQHRWKVPHRMNPNFQPRWTMPHRMNPNFQPRWNMPNRMAFPPRGAARPFVNPPNRPSCSKQPDYLPFKADTFVPPKEISPSPALLSAGVQPTAELLSKMKLVIFLDLDNWPSFFKRLPRCLPDLTFVWGFWGGCTCWREPIGFLPYTEQKRKGWFHLNKKSGRTKDAADFSLVLQVGTMNALLPKTVPFTILSGDRGFCQVEEEICDSDRRLVVIDPHSASKQSPEIFYTMIVSVFQA